MSDLISYGFLTPPAVLILLSLLGALLALRWRGFGIALAILSSVALYALATPLAASYLLQQVENGIPESADLNGAQAIVVLGAGVHLGNGAAAPDTLSPLSLERVFFAAQAYRRLHLPVAVSGGRVFPAQTAEADLMQAALQQEFGIPVNWKDDQSRTTYQNAVFTARLLRPENIETVVIVTHAWHMPRALWSFQHAGLTPLPWPAPRDYARLRRIDDVLPSAAALHDSSYALHEMTGDAYYRLRY
ncbi:MAG: YdcF family protein [Alphaproteobacteria bacterium]|nr:YdcF family protein [Alphaproteobacteria bacterium]MBV9964695.1 YdcF family protein [Alphaproteobacteria bacterium]